MKPAASATTASTGEGPANAAPGSKANRIVAADGTVAPNVRWSDSGDERDPTEVLRAEGALVNGRPDPARDLSSDDLQALIEQ
jgi:hypothetical protein